MNNIIKLTIIAGFMQHFVLASEARIDYVAEVNRLFAPLEQRAAQHAMERNNQNDLIQSLTNQLALSQKELADTKVTLALKERDADVMTATLQQQVQQLHAALAAEKQRAEYFTLLLRQMASWGFTRHNPALLEEIIKAGPKEGGLTWAELEQLTGQHGIMYNGVAYRRRR